MKRIGIVVAGLVMSAFAALAQPPDCVDELARVLNVGIPRTAIAGEESERLARTIADVLGGAYIDRCKELQISFAFGSDYEVMDWLERGSVDAAIVPDLSLWLLTSRDGIPLRELNDEGSSKIDLLRPLVPAPSCRHYEGGRWSACAKSPRATLDALLSNIAAGRPNVSTRVVLASHISSTGFLDPIVRAVPYLQQRGDSVEAREAAWAQLFDAIVFAIDPSPDPFEDVLDDAKALSQLDVVFYPGEETLEGIKEPPSNGSAYREHFVISEAAGTSFTPSAFVDRSARTTPLIAPALQALLMDVPSPQAGNRPWRRRVPPPRPLEVIARPEPVFGIRSFSFSLHESLRLLAQQQRSSGVQQLALVLPGGGVKAAYQSGIVDHLYGQHELRNAHVDPPKGDKALVVDSVLGTSGGALLGYFVSQLGPKGPFTLTNILWKPGGKALGGIRVFGFTDLPRYFSIAWTFFVFCVVLAIFAGRHRSPFYRRSPAQLGAWRIRLFTLFAIFLLVPVLIRLVTGGEDIEHVPVIEGLFYSILTVLVMFADQCLIYDPAQEPGQRSVHTYTIVLLLFGGAAMVTSFFGPTAALQRPVTFRFAFITLLAIFVGCPVVLLYAAGKIGDLRSRLIDVLVSVFVVLTLFAFGVQGWLPAEVPQILALLVLLILAFVVYRNAKRNVSGRFRAALLMFLTVVSTAFLCWLHDPNVRPGLRPSLSFLRSDALENTSLAPFLASTGCLLLVIGAAFWVYQSQAYRLNGDDGFAHAIILLIGHALVAAGLVFAAARLLPGSIHDLEMTGSFWFGLTFFGVLAGAVILVIAPYWDRARTAIEFLNGEHPNGSLVPRRYARMLAIATISVVWWNVVVAPALYGNRSARKYIDGAMARFDAEATALAGQKPGEEPRGYLPTVKFVAPTNTLDAEDATRYFLFLPPDEPPMAVPRSVAGTVWSVYRTSRTPAPRQDCTTIDARCVGFVQDIVFSSGSPFPIFAAHRVNVPDEKRPVDLIDGGYSNDIPIDAARTLKAMQVLIVHSSSPLGQERHDGGSRGLSFSAGLLIRNVKRLPEFMFERSQQADRISRQNLFVVGLAPKVGPSDPWPGLAQFDPPTVNYLIAKAGEDIYQRIAFVESWGEPRFRISQQVKPAGGPARRGARG
jgi:predicted acylesterase/phospholipase RssA